MSNKKIVEECSELEKELIYHAMNNDLEEVKRLLSEKVRYKRTREGKLIERLDINCQNEYGETALYQAANNGHFELIKFLCERGADVNRVNKVK